MGSEDVPPEGMKFPPHRPDASMVISREDAPEELSFEEALALREAVPPEGLALMATLIERDMDHNFNQMSQLYEGEKKRNDELEAEIASLRGDAYKWRQFVGMVEDTIHPWEGEA